MEKTVLVDTKEEALDGPLHYTLSTAGMILAGAADKEMCNKTQVDAPIKKSLARGKEKRRQERLACTRRKNYYPFHLKSVKVDAVQKVRTQAQICAVSSRQSWEKQSVNRLPPEDVTFANNAGITIYDAGSNPPRKTHSVDTEGKSAAGAPLFTGKANDLSEMTSFQQDTRGSLPKHNFTDRTSQQQDKDQSVLNVAPMAAYYPTFGEHFCYELSECKAFWSCDLHYRDWRQIFAASPFPCMLPSNWVFVVRFFMCMVVFVAEIFAFTHSYQDMGWSTFLYFTNTNSILVTLYLLLMTAVSFHALVVWKEPLVAKARSPTEPVKISTGSVTIVQATRSASSASTAGLPSGSSSRESFGKEQRVGSSGDAMASAYLRSLQYVPRLNVQREEDSTRGEDDGKPCISFLTKKIGEALVEMKKMWRLQGYRDLLADHHFCVKGVVFAPNPTYYSLPAENKARECSCGFYRHCREITAHNMSRGQNQAPPVLVRVLWMLHSVQLVSSTTVAVVFFSMMRANGTTFAESWYTGWRHLALIVITILFSVLTTRVPAPICHVMLLYIIAVLYLVLQVFVFVFDLPNGDGDNGCVYRVITLKHPFQFAGFTLSAVGCITLVALFWWSLLRQRGVDVNPPPSVSIPAAEVLEREGFAEEGETKEQQPEGHQRKCFAAQLLRFWGKTHGRNQSSNDAPC